MSSPMHENELLETGIQEKVVQLLEYVKSSAGKEEIHIVEKEIFRQVKQIGLASLQLFIEKSGTGYEANNPLVSEDGNNLENKVCPASPYFSILDIIHACEYVWEAGTAIHGEKSSKRRQWVRKKLLDLLDGKVGYVIGALKQIKNKRKLSESKLETLDKVIRYFTNHKHMMKYDEYLAKGYPIGTGVVESARGSLVKNRMERNGMRWGMTGAQAMLDLRAVKKNTDWKNFMEIYINEQKNILYSDDYKRKMVA